MPRKLITAQTEVGGVRHKLDVRRKRQNFSVWVDEAETARYKGNGFWLGVYQDFEFVVDGYPHVLAVRGAGMRLARDGRYLDDGSEHRPPGKVPAWFFLFALLDALLLLVAIFSDFGRPDGYYGTYLIIASAMNGAVAGAMAACALMMGYFFVKGGRLGKLSADSAAGKFIACLVVTVIAWGIWAGYVMIDYL